MVTVARSILGRIDLALIDDAPLPVFQLAKKAALVAFVTGGGVAPLLHRQEHRVVVAVQTNLMYYLKISRLFAFAPQAPARARKIAGASGGDGLVEGLAVHVGHHQQPSAAIVHRDHRHDATAFVEIDYGTRLIFHNKYGAV